MPEMADSSAREKVPKPSGVATPKKRAMRPGAEAESNRLGGCGLPTRPSTSKTGFSSASWNTGSATISSRGSMRKMSARSRSALVSATRKTPVEISIQASA